MSRKPDAPPSDDDATRQRDSERERPKEALRSLASRRSTASLPQHPTLCIRLGDDGFPKSEHDPRLKKLDWRDRQKFLIWALGALAITPREYLHQASFFFENSTRDNPTMQAQWLRIARIVRAAFYEAENVDSEFLTTADAAARVALEKHNETHLFSARSVAFEHLRDDVAILLEQGLETVDIAVGFWTSMSEAKYHEIARIIPDLNRAKITDRKMLRKLEMARTNPATLEDFKKQAKGMILAWLRAMGCPHKIAKSAFDAARARNARENGKRG